MAESTLSSEFTELRENIARFFGFGRLRANWTPDQARDINSVLRRGIRQFLIPPPINPNSVDPIDRVGHTWSFLRPTTTILVWPAIATNTGETVTGGTHSTTLNETTLTYAGTGASPPPFHVSMVCQDIVVTGVGTFTIKEYLSTSTVKVIGDASAASGATFSIAAGNYGLPDDFGGIEGPVNYVTDTIYPPITITSESRIRSQRQREDALSTFRPRLGAVRPCTTGGQTGQRFELMLWPKPDADYTLEYKYIVNVDAITSASKFPVGGMQHSETILASCIALAEHLLEPQPRVHRAHERFMRQLAASVSRDRMANTPDSFGLNLDRSSASITLDDLRRDRYVTVNGVIPT